MDENVSEDLRTDVGHRPPGRAGALQRLRSGDFGLPALLVLFVVTAGVVLGGASLGGWGAIAIILIAMVAFIALLYEWVRAL